MEPNRAGRLQGILYGLRHHLLATVLFVISILVIVPVVRFVARVDALYHRRSTSPAWSFPSVVYSADVPLNAGREISPEYLRAELEARSYRQSSTAMLAPGEFHVEDGQYDIALRGLLDVPDPAGYGGPERVRFRVRGGHLGGLERRGGFAGCARPDSLHAPRLEPMPFATISNEDAPRRSWVPISRIPRVLQDAVIISEDRRFRSHGGFDIRGGIRALFANMRGAGTRQGGSTITQQLARALFLSRERKISRKLTELRLAIGLEVLLSKPQLLEMYLNSVYLGQRDGQGIAGVAEGAAAFFGVPVDSLTLDQAALLTCVIPAPNAFSPWRDPERVRRRRDRLIDAMVATGTVSAQAGAEARRRPISISQAPMTADRFSSVIDRVREEMQRTVSADALEGHGYVILTNVDPVWQSIAERSVSETLDRLDPGSGGAEPLQGALVMMEAQSGSIRALVGSREPLPGGYNYALDSARQPGSAAKPFVYATALMRAGDEPKLTPASTVPDLPRVFSSGGKRWEPRNHDGSYHGRISLAMALARSQNLATINLVELLGPAAVARTFERFGLHRPAPQLAIGLGTDDANLLDMTAAYAAFPAGGIRSAPAVIRAAFDSERHDRTPRVPGPTRALDGTTTAEMITLMQNVIDVGTAHSLRWQYGFDRPCAGKTGTTNDQRDAWFLGFTPELVAGVWVGYPTPRSIGRSGAGAALPIWGSVMRQALEGFPRQDFPKRAGVEFRWIDGYSGRLARVDCPARIRIPWRTGELLPDTCVTDHTADWEAIRAKALADSLARRAADSLAARARDSLATRGSR